MRHLKWLRRICASDGPLDPGESGPSSESWSYSTIVLIHEIEGSNSDVFLCGRVKIRC